MTYFLHFLAENKCIFHPLYPLHDQNLPPALFGGVYVKSQFNKKGSFTLHQLVASHFFLSEKNVCSLLAIKGLPLVLFPSKLSRGDYYNILKTLFKSKLEKNV